MHRITAPARRRLPAAPLNWFTAERLESRRLLSAASAAAADRQAAPDPDDDNDCDDAVFADFNGDGRTDVARVLTARDAGSGIATGRRQHKLVVDVGLEDTTLESRRTWVIPHVLELHAGDVDGDGNLDLVVTAREAGSGQATGRREAGSGLATGRRMTVLFGKGDGDFEQRKTWVIPHVLEVAGVADFNGDGLADLCVISPRDPASGQAAGQQVVIVQGDGRGRFTRSFPIRGWDRPIVDVVVGDMDARMGTDFAVLLRNDNSRDDDCDIAMFLNDGKGTFTDKLLPRTIRVGEGDRVAAGDLDGDGRADIAVGGGAGGAIHLYFAGDGQRETPFSRTAQLKVPASVGSGPFCIAIEYGDPDSDDDGPIDSLFAYNDTGFARYLSYTNGGVTHEDTWDQQR